jgi:uncharacterized protein
MNTRTSNQNIQAVLSMAIVLFFTACNFNSQVLAPVKVSSAVKEFTMETFEDTLIVHLPVNGNQIVLTKNKGDTVDLGFTIENIFFKSSYGNMLNGWFLKPKNQTPEITLLHLHGAGKFIGDHYKYISPLVKNGFQIFMFDYSGFGFSEGEASRENIRIDMLSAVDYLKTRQDVKQTKLVTYGQSLGAHYSTFVGPMAQTNIDGMVIESPITSFKEIAGDRIPIIGNILMKQGYHAEKAIRDYHKPLLLIHSSEDKEAPFWMGKKIFENANQPKEFYEIKKCHCCGLRYYADEISEKIKSMLNARLNIKASSNENN